MDIFSLVATLGLDSVPFISGINSAQQLFSSFASAVVGFANDVMQTGLGFDQAMANVQSVLGQEQGTVENMNRLRAFALDQARSSIYTAEDTAQAYYYMGMAGWDAQQMMAGLPGVMALAAASGESLGTVSDIVTDSLTAFGLTANDTQHYVDVLAQTATNANTNVGLMGETFKYVAPIAGALGADVDDVAVSIGLMANSGIKGSMAGTALRQIFTRISTNAGATTKSLGALDIITQELGVSFRDSEGKMRDWGDVVADIRVKWKDLSDEQQVAYAKQIASERGMAGWLALMNASETDVQKLTAAIGQATDAAQTMSEVRLDSLSGDITKFNSALDIMKIAIYDDVKGPMRDVVQWATDAINEITDAINENGLAGGIEVLGQKIEEAGEKFAPLLESIGKAAGPLVNAIFDNVLPRLTEAGAKLGAGLLQGLSDGIVGDGSGTGSNLAGIFLSAMGQGLTIISTVSGWLKEAGNQGGTEMWQEVSAAADPVMKENPLPLNDWLTAGYDPTMIPDGIYSATEEKAPDIQQTLTDAATNAGTEGGKTMTDNLGAKLTEGETAMRDGLAEMLGAAGAPAGQTIASAIGTELSSHTYSINVQANVSGLPAHHNASAMTAGRIFTRATVFGFANGRYQVAGDAGPEAVIGTNSLAQLIQSAVRGAMGGQSFTTPMAGGAPRNIVVKLMLDGRELAQTAFPYMSAEEQRVGLSLVTR